MATKDKQQGNVRFMAVGDMMFCCKLGEHLRSSGNYDHPFEKIRDFLQQADFLYGNFETMITAEHQVEKFAGPGLYYADPPIARALGRANFKAVNLAHNHLYDFGTEGVELTMQLLSDAGVMYHGVGKDVLSARKALEVQVKDFKLGMLSYCGASCSIDEKHKYVTCPIKTEIIRNDVSELSKRADFMIVVLHEGTCSYPSPQHRAWAKAAVDAGAKLLISHHSHVINGIEEYNGAVIAYGLGDFVATFEGKESADSFILDCDLRPDGTIEHKAVPIFINENIQVEIATGKRRTEIMSYIGELSSKLHSDESDREYYSQMGENFIGFQWRELCRNVNSQGLGAISRKLRKLRMHHLKLLINSIVRKLKC